MSWLIDAITGRGDEEKALQEQREKEEEVEEKALQEQKEKEEKEVEEKTAKELVEHQDLQDSKVVESEGTTQHEPTLEIDPKEKLQMDSAEDRMRQEISELTTENDDV